MWFNTSAVKKRTFCVLVIFLFWTTWKELEKKKTLYYKLSQNNGKLATHSTKSLTSCAMTHFQRGHQKDITSCSPQTVLWPSYQPPSSSISNGHRQTFSSLQQHGANILLYVYLWAMYFMRNCANCFQQQRKQKTRRQRHFKYISYLSFQCGE